MHFRKYVYNFLMAEDQRFILERITDIVKSDRPDTVVIAGDVYDITVPTEKAISTLEDFLERFTSLGARLVSSPVTMTLV